MEPIVPATAELDVKEKKRIADPELSLASDVEQASLNQPLSWETAEELQDKYGKNVIASQRPPSWYRLLWRSVIHPFNFILSILATVSGATKDYRTMAVMLFMIILSAGIRFYQELKAELQVQKLKSLIQNKATVLRLYRPPSDRDPNWDDVARMNEVVRQEIPIVDLVPGDVIKLSAGDMIPADIQLLESKDLFVSQSALTGEALPVEKFVVGQQDDKIATDQQLQRSDLCFMGANVVSGTGTAIVLAIGDRTMFGELAKRLQTKKAPTSFEKGVKHVSYMFIGIMVVMIPTVIVISGLVQKNWLKAFLFAIAVAVGLTPEMLPMIVNANLAKGSIAMQRKRTIVKKMGSIIDLGSMDVLCTDKTGTLTMDQVTLIKYLDLDGKMVENRLPIELAYLNSHFQTGLKNLLDAAVISYFSKLDPEGHVQAKYTKLDEIPFDFVRRRMSVVLCSTREEESLLITKGAVEETLSVCSRVHLPDGTDQPLSQERLAHARTLVEDMNEDGLRVVAVAFKRLPIAQAGVFSVKDESELAFVGLIAFLDPPKPTTAPAVTAVLSQGVTIKVLTGDNPLVCKKICREVGIPVDRVVVSSDLKGLDDSAIADIAEQGSIFARLTPLEKAKIVTGLRTKGHTVGFLGDGINDAAALKAADVGISVDTATDIAKDAADIIMLEKDLMVLSRGIREGRKTYANTIKYIKMAVSSNFGNVFSVLIASAWLKFLPILPIHIVVQNLLYDISQIAIPWDRVDEEFLAKPRTWSVRSILRFMLCIGPVSCIFDITTFLFMFYYYDIQKPTDNILRFQTAWFVEGLLTQTLIIHMIRTAKIPFIQSRPAIVLIIGTILVMAIATSLPFTPLNHFLRMERLPRLYFAYLAGALVGYCILINVAKFFYIRAFHEWL